VGKRQRRDRRQELLTRVADAYWANYESWSPTEGVAKDLDMDLALAEGLVGQAREMGIIEERRPDRWR
jgi:hypothetical protein